MGYKHAMRETISIAACLILATLLLVTIAALLWVAITNPVFPLLTGGVVLLLFLALR